MICRRSIIHHLQTESVPGSESTILETQVNHFSQQVRFCLQILASFKTETYYHHRKDFTEVKGDQVAFIFFCKSMKKYHSFRHRPLVPWGSCWLLFDCVLVSCGCQIDMFWQIWAWIQIHTYQCTLTNTYIQIQKYKYRNTNTQIPGQVQTRV